ncbi:hypothetical protein C8R43DRAFT_1121059 [Mycena crocata]|nr:hypothetical protein C8R43DRAFT_1121059 [Mycena crocata]
MPPPTEAFNVRRIIEAIVVYCPWPDFISVCHVNSRARQACSIVFVRRIIYWLCFFLLPAGVSFHERRIATYLFLDALLLTDAGVVGSVVLALFTVAAVEDADVPIDNLNILVPYHNLGEWRELLEGQFNFRLVVTLLPRVDWSGHMHSYLQFTRNGKKITISTTTSGSILPALLGSQLTTQMNVLLRDKALSFYPHLTMERKGLLGWPAPAPVPWMFNPNGGSVVPGISYMSNNAALGRPCGGECTRIWRAVRGLAAVGQFRFNDQQDFGEHVIGQERDLLWRIEEVQLVMYNNIPPEIEAHFLEDVDWSDVVSYSRSSPQGRATAQFMLGLHVNQALQPFVPPDHRDNFWSLLGAGQGGVTGSTPFWVTEKCPTWRPRDLNTIVRHGGGDALRAFLRSWGCTQTDLAGRIPQVRTTASGNRPVLSYRIPSEYCTFNWLFTTPQGTQITVTETQDASVVRHLLGSAHTLQTMLLTRNIVLAFHPQHCTTRRAVFRTGAMSSSMEVNRAMDLHILDMGVTRGNSGVASGNCGQQCLGLLRRVRGGRDIGLMRWSGHGALDEFDTDAYGGFMQAKYGYCWTWSTCQTTQCELYHFPRDIRVLGRPPALHLRETNPKLDLVTKKKYAIMNCTPGFATIYEGLLFATSCPDCMLVPVPLDYGIQTYTTMDDLRAYTWVPASLVRIPLLFPPTETVGSVTCIHPLSWRVATDNGMTMLVFMAAIRDVAPINISIVPDEGGSKSAYGDILLMLEDAGKIVHPGAHVSMCRKTFQSWWDLGGGLACDGLY